MKVLFINRVYPSVPGATGQLLLDLAEALATRGHAVAVLTSREDSSLSRSEVSNGVRIERVGSGKLEKSNFWKRLLHYAALYPALLWRAIRLPHFDFIVTLTDPPMLVVLSPLIAALKGARAVHWAQDVYPEVAEALGAIRKNGFAAKLCRALSNWALRHQERVVVVGRCMRQRLIDRGIPENKLRVVPNWAHQVPPRRDEPAIFPLPLGREGHGEGVVGSSPDAPLPDQHVFFVAMYSGNLGLAHSFEALIEAAHILNAKNSITRFVIVGDGPRLNFVRTEVERLNLRNVRFLPPQPREKLAAVLESADIHLVTMRDEACGLVVPSKAYGVLAAGKPCIFVGPGESEVARLIEEHQCGNVVTNGDAKALAECLENFAANPKIVQLMGMRAKKASTTATLDRAVAAFESLLTS